MVWRGEPRSRRAGERDQECSSRCILLYTLYETCAAVGAPRASWRPPRRPRRATRSTFRCWGRPGATRRRCGDERDSSCAFATSRAGCLPRVAVARAVAGAWARPRSLKQADVVLRQCSRPWSMGRPLFAFAACICEGQRCARCCAKRALWPSSWRLCVRLCAMSPWAMSPRMLW